MNEKELEPGMMRPSDKPVAEYKWLYINEVEPPSKRKTKHFEVVNKSQGLPLGEIGWYGAWRKYCFFIEKGCLEKLIFSGSCLDDISHFLKKINDEWKRSQKGKR